ncbi:leucyl aminopeptidase [Roseospirillum parvum]|uniref:Probable cytosol aminopeptidase n=1 Tax=Roseospirillum parvum TaxID=83401 RepID=A0A1G7XPJ8_9PROT|nr:leucyl aminopeptidase [Roseospirillum parvum]SDG86124.1 leucyl aminopeptidase [Roseospirillum parvum]
MKLGFSKRALPETGALAVGVLDGGTLTPLAEELDALTEGALTRAIKGGLFTGKRDQTLVLPAPAGTKLSHVLLLGLGPAAELTAVHCQNLGGTAYGRLAAVGAESVAIVVDDLAGLPVAPAEAAAEVAFGARLAAYRFDRYRTSEKKEDKPRVKKITILTDAARPAKTAWAAREALAEGVILARDLVSEPANILSPEEFAKRAQELEAVGLTVKVLDEKEMARLGMGALLGVGQGSAQDSRLVTLEWAGGKKKADPVAFVGKGVCFDSGGISIKPAGGMEDMKWDMGGAAVVTGLMKTLALRKAKLNAVGILGLVENMPSGTAQRPGDVVTSLSGQTIEVINTDAEGRLVLADALTYVQDTFNPKAIIDLATLTGAIIISLGSEHAGLFSNDDTLAGALAEAGLASGEKLWRLPLDAAYDKQLKSEIADMKNVGGREAGSITAAQFLKRFIKNDTPWAHLDIAGVTWSKKDSPTVPKGGTGFGVRLLDRLVSETWES